MRLAVFLVILTFYKNCAAGQNSTTLCSFEKSTNLCSCGHKLNGQTSIFAADCARISIKSFPRDRFLPNVEELDISFNLIDALEAESHSFQSDLLVTLRLSNNLITHVSPDFFSGVPNLKKLDLSSNKIERFVNSNIFRGLENLTSLDLSRNSLSTLPENIFFNLANLKELDLSYNHFGSLLMSSDDLFSVGMGIPLGIERLELNGLEMTDLNYMYFEKSPNLKRLGLADNLFKLIPTVPYTLDYLDVSRNPIGEISAGQLNYHSLKVLKLNHLNSLRKVEHYAFYNLQQLQELHLTNCKKLQSFSDLAFGVITQDLDLQLKRIFLSGNALTSLNSTYLRLLMKMEQVDLQNNPWNCDCSILWLKQLEGLLHKDYNMRCLTPSRLRNKRVLSVEDKNVPDCVVSRRNTQKVLITVLCVLIVLLTALIIYLFYLAPFNSRNRSRGIGPQSPYHSNTIGVVPVRAENLFN